MCYYRRVTAYGRVAYDGNNDKEEIVGIDEADSNVRNSVAVAMDINTFSSHCHGFS